LAEEEKEDEDDGDGTLVETPTRCNNTKNSLDDRVRMSSAILTAVAAGGSVGLVAPRAARLRRVGCRGGREDWKRPAVSGSGIGDDSIVTVIVARGRGVTDCGQGDEQDVDGESISSSSLSIWGMIRSFIESRFLNL
jgi:hypothetical protein